jgi:hypothetical protein
VTAGYYRNSSGNFRVTDNLVVGPEDYDPYCITARVDPQLPGGGGYPICGLYDVVPSKVGLVQNLVTRASHYGKQTQVSDFLSFTINARPRSGAQLGGGIDTGRTVADSCFVVDSPQQLLNCRVVTPFKAQTQLKLFGSYPLPGEFVLSGTFQQIAGIPIAANYQATNAEIMPSLGRNLSACRGQTTCSATALVPLIAPQTMFEDGRTQLDLRLSKLVRIGPRVRIQANLDVYNALNANTVVAINTTYGSASWRRPTVVLDSRLVQFGGQVSF